MISAPSAQRKGVSRIGVVIALTLILIYAVKLGILVLEARSAELAAAGMRAEVESLEAQVEALETAALDAASDEYVEEWAREKRTMARPGDHVVVPIAAPLEPVAPEPTAEAQAELSAWKRLKLWLKREERSGETPR